MVGPNTIIMDTKDTSRCCYSLHNNQCQSLSHIVCVYVCNICISYNSFRYVVRYRANFDLRTYRRYTYGIPVVSDLVSWFS